MNNIIEKWKILESKYPCINEYMMKTFIEQMPHEAEEALDEYETIQEFGYHISNKDMYDRYIAKLPEVKWEHDTIKSLSKIDFDEKEYYSWDFAALMNYLHYLFKDYLVDSTYYTKMTKSLLENPLQENSDDLAFHIFKKIKLE